MTNHVKVYGVKPRIQYTADGTSTSYDFPFAIFKPADLDVYLSDVLQESSAYTVSGDDYSNGGTITFGTTPTSGTTITIIRNLSIERTSDFQEGSILRAETLNDELDYQIACQQQIADNLNRSMVLPPYAADSGLDLTLPTPSAGKAIVWNSAGTNLENSTVSVNALESTLNGYKTTAQTAATTATSKAEIATTQAQTATTQAGIATTQAGIATTKASEVASALSNKANTTLDNLTTLGQKTITGLCVPNYTTGVSFTGKTWVQAPYDCYVTGGATSGSNIAQEIRVNLTNTDTNYVRVAYSYGYSAILGAFVPKGYYFRVEASGTTPTHETVYYKLKGASA
ncbi:MAG: hypothetical protein J6Y03_02350 [Alphaproteobacteria bacterium]|nr:hypothetical protein [Alphaproteobacteria bacterium]